MKFSLEEILKATGAKVLSELDGEFSEVVHQKFPPMFNFSTDTRTIKEGEIYLPLKGENFDGAKFIDKALETGAAGYFTTEISSKNEILNNKKVFACSSQLTAHTSQHPLVLQVEDTKIAYLQLANFYRNKINPKTIAITGSSGKTTTKEMAYCVAKENFKTHKSELNFNNEIGLCKTILSMPEDTEVLILEMGMRGLGEIELLSKYAEPDIAIIVNVGTSHIGRLGSRENIAKAKCEIIKYLKEDGKIIAHDDELIKTTLCSSNSTTFSLNDAKILTRKVGYSKFVYKNNEYELNIEGDYNVQNSLAAIEMGLELKIAPAEINEGLKKYSPIEKRWEVQEIKGYKIINDSYNANPDSMKAAIETSIDLYEPPLLFVLGDMGELGENEIQYHEQISDFLQTQINNKKTENISVITVGKLAYNISKRLNEDNISSKNFDDTLQTSRYILDNVKIGTTIVLKASRSMKFEEILEQIKNC